MITTLINADDVQYAQEITAQYNAMQFAIDHPRLAVICGWFSMVYCIAVEHTICRWFGHDLYDSGSYATPDSGADDLTCGRCGYNFHHIYY